MKSQKLDRQVETTWYDVRSLLRKKVNARAKASLLEITYCEQSFAAGTSLFIFREAIRGTSMFSLWTVSHKLDRQIEQLDTTFACLSSKNIIARAKHAWKGSVILDHGLKQ